MKRPSSRQRDPNNIAYVAERYITILGYRRVMKIMGMTKHKVYAAADEEKGFQYDVEDFIKLDRICHAETEDPEAPFAEWVWDQVYSNTEPGPVCITTEMLEIHSLGGQTAQHVKDATCPKSENGKRWSLREARPVQALLYRLRRVSFRMGRGLDREVTG
ncbi:MAG: hypothetical protein ACR2PW_04665 [Gammaproteobacteria bacterium]